MISSALPHGWTQLELIVGQTNEPPMEHLGRASHSARTPSETRLVEPRSKRSSENRRQLRQRARGAPCSRDVTAPNLSCHRALLSLSSQCPRVRRPMLKAVLLIGTTWTTLSLLFCLAWARALMALSDTRCTAMGSLRAERPRVGGLPPFSPDDPSAQASCKWAHTVTTGTRSAYVESPLNRNVREA